MSANFVCNAHDEGPNHEKVNCMKNLIGKFTYGAESIVAESEL